MKNLEQKKPQTVYREKKYLKLQIKVYKDYPELLKQIEKMK